MCPTFPFAVIVLASLWLPVARAQSLGSLSVSPPSAKTGEPVTVTATLNAPASQDCGFMVLYGDGTSAESDLKVNKPNPFVTSHTYARPGQYTVTLAGRGVPSLPQCGGAEKLATVTITEAVKPLVKEPPKPAEVVKPVAPTAATACPAPWKLVPKSFIAKTGAFACTAKAGTPRPPQKPSCSGDLTYFENAKKSRFGCGKPRAAP